MYDKTYSLVTRTEAECDQATAQAPVTSLRAGDIVLSGTGTLQLHYREVVSVEKVFNDYGAFTVATFADGRTLADTAGGFWYSVIRADPSQQRATAETASAYARAWDRKR